MRTAAATIATAGLVLAGSACGGSPGSQVAQVGSNTTRKASANSPMLAYSTCMRAHGVPTFPDPDSSGGIPKPRVVAAAEADPNTFKAAQGSCGNLLPNGSLEPPRTAQQRRARLADELSFARCMRTHGLARFPDPTTQAGLSLEMVRAQGIDVSSPAVLRIVQACLPASHGALTMAKVREALGNAGR